MTNQEFIKSIHALYRGETPQDNIDKLLVRHGCDYLLTKIKSSPYNQQLALKRIMSSIAVKERYTACTFLFEQSDIPYAIIKGAVLSKTLYTDPFIRPSGDIDILIRREDADKLKHLLQSNGFIQGRITDHGIEPFNRREILFQTSMSHQTAPYIKETGNKFCPYINLDVNMNLLWGETDEKTDMNYVLTHVEKIMLFGNTLNKLSPEMELVALCLHHYKDMNSLYLLTSGSFRFKLFCEIYDYLRNVNPDAKIIHEHCKRLNVGRYVYVCIAQTQEIFSDEHLDTYLNALEEWNDPSLFETYGLTPSERKAWKLELFERLFHLDLANYVFSQLTEEEKEKVNINRNFM